MGHERPIVVLSVGVGSDFEPQVGVVVHIPIVNSLLEYPCTYDTFEISFSLCHLLPITDVEFHSGSRVCREVHLHPVIQPPLLSSSTKVRPSRQKSGIPSLSLVSFRSDLLDYTGRKPTL